MKTTGKLLALSLALLLFLTLLPGCGKSPEGMELYFFAAGKADAILITAPGAAVMVDTGEKGFGKEILDYLEEKGIGKLDALILTHFDKDHVGGAAKLLSGIPIDRVIQSNVPRDSGEYRDYVRALERAGLEAETPREPLTLSLGDLEIMVDPPKQEEYEKDPSNNSSLIVSVRYGDTSALLTGDAEEERLAEWLEQEPGHYDLIKMPHHGSWEQPLSELLALTEPQYAVLTDSEREPASDKTIALLTSFRVETFSTKDGALLFRSDGEGLKFIRQG